MCYQNCPDENKDGECKKHKHRLCDIVWCPRCDEELTGLEIKNNLNKCPECDYDFKE